MSRSTVPKRIKDMLPKQCCNCGSTENLIYHHIVPDELGGRTIPSNIAVVCGECHGKIHFGDKDVIIHGDLIKRGIAKAKERGVKLGKPSADYEKVIRLIAEHSTQFNDIYNADYELYAESEIMEMAGVKSFCYYKCKRMLIDAMNSDVWPYSWQKPKLRRNHPIYEHLVYEMRGCS